MNLFLGKKILIYGLGKSGISTFKFLKNKCNVYLYDDLKSKINNFNKKNKLINIKEILSFEFDRIIISPGIDVNKCNLSNFLKNNKEKIYSDLDVFYEFYKNDCITITGTNGKSTTCQLLYEILLNQKYKVRLVGNIGNPILDQKNITKKTIFIVEASSYQLEYSRLFKSKYGAILNLSPDHLERHKTMSNYVKAKFRLLKNQPKHGIAFVKKNDVLIEKQLNLIKSKKKIIKVNCNKNFKFLQKIDNNYFSTDTNMENLKFVLEISKKLNLKIKPLIQSINNFKGLKYRQQIIYKKRNLTIINDSKSTSFASSISILKTNQNIFWILGGIYKKGDKFKLPKKYYNKIRAFIFGKKTNFFKKELKGKITYECFHNLNEALKRIFTILKRQKKNQNILFFSPSAASFDNFKNFEDRGLYFNDLIKKYLNGKKKNII